MVGTIQPLAAQGRAARAAARRRRWRAGAGRPGPLLRAAKPQEAKPLIGTPQVVKDLHWGDVLFYFYQGDYMQALTRLGAAQDFNRLTHHTVEAELLKGGLYLSLGEHEEAGRIFHSLLNDNVPLDVRNRAWFYLAKVWYQREYLQQAADALASIKGALPGDLEPERHLLEAQVLMYLDRYDDAIRALERWQPVRRRQRRLVRLRALQHRRCARAQGAPRRSGEAARRRRPDRSADRGARRAARQGEPRARLSRG